MSEHEKINYVEFPACDLEMTKRFFNTVFGWQFQDFGSEYTAFGDDGLDGGFYRADLKSRTSSGSALVVFYSKDLEGTLKKIEGAGGEIVEPIFGFPGGRRFHFCEPSGNEFAVWTKTTDSQI